MNNIMTNVIKRLKTLKEPTRLIHCANHTNADARAFVDWCDERNIDPFPIALKRSVRVHRVPPTERGLQLNPSADLITRRLNKMLGFEDQTRTEEIYLAIRRLEALQVHGAKTGRGDQSRHPRQDDRRPARHARGHAQPRPTLAWLRLPGAPIRIGCHSE